MKKIRSSKDTEFIKKRKARKLSIIEAGAFSVSDGFGLRNIAPYALALNASNSVIGLLTSIPSLLGNASQILTYRLMKNSTRKKLVSNAVFVQAIFWLLLLIPGIIFLKGSNKSFPIILLIAIYTGLIVSGSLAGPAWMSWMKDIVSEKNLGRYFAKRNKFAGAITFICMILAGLILDHFNKIQVLYGFFILFIVSFLFRTISGILITRQYEPKFKENQKSYFSFIQFIDNMPFNNFGRFVFFLALMNFAVAIASPFFAVYLIKQKEFSYVLYFILTMIMPLSSILTMSHWGAISDRFGDVKVLKITGLFIALIPLIYLISDSISNFTILLVILFSVEVFAGITWGGFNLSISNFVFKIVSREKMIICSAYMNLINGISIFLGAIMGGFIASVSFSNPILIVFLVSGFGRIIVYLILLPKIKERKDRSKEYKGGFIGNIFLAPRFFNPMRGTNYAIKIIKKEASLFKKVLSRLD